MSTAGKTARELAELLFKQGDTAVESAEAVASRLARIESQCGQGSLAVAEQYGWKAVLVMDKAGDEAGPYLVRAIERYGADGIRLANTPMGRASLREGSEQTVQAVIRHTDQVWPMIRETGEAGARALNTLSPQNGRRGTWPGGRSGNSRGPAARRPGWAARGPASGAGIVQAGNPPAGAGGHPERSQPGPGLHATANVTPPNCQKTGHSNGQIKSIVRRLHRFS